MISNPGHLMLNYCMHYYNKIDHVMLSFRYKMNEFPA